MTTTPDLFLAQLVLEYLATAESAAKGVPDIPKDLMDSGKEIARPSLVIAAREDDKQSGGGKRVVRVTPILATWLKAAGNDAVPVESQTTREQASTWLRAIDDRLRDEEAFADWLATLPAERLEGMSFLARPRYGGAAVPLRGEATGEVSYAVTVTYHLIVCRMT